VQDKTAELQAAAESGYAVTVRRSPKKLESLTGFCTAVGDQWAVLHLINDDAYVLDGHRVIRLADVRAVEVRREDHVLQRGLELFCEPKPERLAQVGLNSAQEVVAGAMAAAGLVSIHTEKLHHDTLNIGVPKKYGRTFLHLREVDTQARWYLTRKYRWEDITQVQIGSRYELALYDVAGSP
jgi:hypothetical protein